MRGGVLRCKHTELYILKKLYERNPLLTELSIFLYLVLVILLDKHQIWSRLVLLTEEFLKSAQSVCSI